MRADRGFTVIEIIVVIVIVLVLASILVPVVLMVRRRGRETECLNNMKQIHLALQMFRDDNISQGRELNPDWLNTLVWDNPGKPDTNPDPLLNAKPTMAQELLICPLDGSKGKQGGKPDGPGIDQYEELDEYKYFSDLARFNPPRDRRSSYMYEFNMRAECTQWNWRSYIFDYMEGDAPADLDAFVELGRVGPDGDIISDPGHTTWGEAKTAQMRHGDSWLNADPPGSGPPYLPKSQWHGYADTRFPVLRCFWHTDDPNTNRPKIRNLSYAGQVFLSGAKWEEESLH